MPPASVAALLTRNGAMLALTELEFVVVLFVAELALRTPEAPETPGFGSLAYAVLAVNADAGRAIPCAPTMLFAA